jgi:N-acetyl-1-D-myo-inositol-2-amino-2-deoxy-alpha-D-glucopyranoside deacetylase
VLGLPTAFAAGVVIGVLGTFKHQVGVSAATGAGVPIGLVLSLALIAAVLGALRVAFATRHWAVAAAAGVVAAVSVLSLPGPGGSRVVVANVEGVIWTIAPVILAAVIVGFPRIGRARSAQAADGILVAPPEGPKP